ncbi:ABC transporter permease [Streptomyces lonarensis]|uniref:ABC transporter permease n=1 Tax=Streptomyces lonarensis TaxID=700599 RepID=UPI0030C6EA92
MDDGDDLPRAWVPLPEIQARAGSAPQAQLQILARTPTGSGAARDVLARATESHAVPLTGAIVRVDTVDDLASTLAMLRGIFFGVGAITLTVGVIGVLNIGLASLRERAEELALRRALGARRSDVAILVLAESVLIGLLGAATAIAGATGLFHTLVPALWGSAGNVGFPLSAGFAGLAAGALAGLAGGAVPALRAARLPIATVMRA